ncbi:MAG: FHA domain-containing protein [Anaerolineae bacterium]|nr:FHA domain-containing protein [Anaerolineae bacterium]
MITSGRQEGAEIPLYTDSVTIGRAVASATWEIRLEDRAVSRPHCTIEKKPEGWVLIDLGSANGTLVNGKSVTGSVPLSDGAVITCGQTNILFRLGQAEAETQVP